MDCIICKHGETEPDDDCHAERGDSTLVIKGVPAQVCANCGEAYVDEKQRALAETAETEVRAGHR